MDIWDKASDLVRRHGHRAPVHAAYKHDVALARGDVEAARRWRQVRDLIEKILDSGTSRTQ